MTGRSIILKLTISQAIKALLAGERTCGSEKGPALPTCWLIGSVFIMKPVEFIITGFIFENEFVLSKNENTNGEGEQG